MNRLSLRKLQEVAHKQLNGFIVSNRSILIYQDSYFQLFSFKVEIDEDVIETIYFTKFPHDFGLGFGFATPFRFSKYDIVTCFVDKYNHILLPNGLFPGRLI